MKPYKLIVTDDPDQTLGEGRIRHYRTMLQAANAFAKAREPFKTVIYDNGHGARELNDREEALLVRVCGMLGLDVEEVER